MALEQPNGSGHDDPIGEGIPEAGPSRSRPHSPVVVTSVGDPDSEELERQLFLKSKEDYLELQRSVESSTELLSRLSSYLSTFQTDLSAVSGQISGLQERSSAIDGRLQGRKAVLPSLSALIEEIVLPPAFTRTIRDTTPSQKPEEWLVAIQELERRLAAVKTRRKVKATQELVTVLEGLRARSLDQLPPFLLSLIRPLRSASTGLSTNLAVLQTSVLLKYQPFYAFLLRDSPLLAKQVERGYVNASRAYFETGLRRYTRSLSQIKARMVEKMENMGSTDTSATGTAGKTSEMYDRLKFANLDVEGEDGSVVLAYMADNKDFRLPLEALFRSLSLVLLDNASAEFTFIVRFFARASISRQNDDRPPYSRNQSYADGASEAGSRMSRPQKSRPATSNEPDMKDAERIWHEVFDSGMEYVTGFFDSITTTLTSLPPTVPLLTMIRLNDRLIETCDARGAVPLSSFLQRQKLALWPIFRKEMDGHFDGLKKLADLAEGKGMFGGKGVKDGAIRQVANRYASMFSCFVALSEEADEVMLFSSMTRLRSELVRLTHTEAKKLKTPSEQHSFTSSIYEIIMHELVAGPGQVGNPRIQSELSFFRTREEEARRRITAA